MIWWLLLLPFTALAQEQDLDLKILEKLEDAMPDYQLERPAADAEVSTQGPRKYVYPVGEVSLREITTSGVALGAVRQGTTIIRLDDDAKFVIPKNMNVNYHLLEDEKGFKYLVSRGKVRFKVYGDHVINTSEVTNLFEPPDQYTPAPNNIVQAEYDRKLRIVPEVIFHAGLVDGSYMADLFNDERARYGQTTQFGLRAIARWDWPILAGVAFSYERASYDLQNKGEVNYTSPSVGPLFRTKDFVLLDFPFRFQTQYRVSPLARADIETPAEDLNLKFNSSDFMLSAEHPVKNSWGEFVVGIFFQAQWLNLRDQETATKLIANNQTNNSYGLSFSQVFE